MTTKKPLLQVGHIHNDVDHPDETLVSTQSTRIGHKVNKTVELRISRVIQECQVCKNKNRLFSHGHGKKYNTSFNTDILVRREVVTSNEYYTHLFTLECMDTGYTVAKYINTYKYDSRYDMLNKVALDLWAHG